MTVPPDDPFGAPATDHDDERASALLDEGRAATDADLDPAVAARLRAMTTARRALRDVPPPDPARRDAAIAAALAAFGTEPSVPATPDATVVRDATTSIPATGAVVGIERGRSARRRTWGPQRLLGAAAAIAVLGLGAFAVSRSSSEQKSSGASASLATKAAGNSTAAAAPAAGAPTADAGFAAGGGSEAATTAAAAAASSAAATTTAAASGATTTVAASTTAGAPSSAALEQNLANLPSLGSVSDVAQLRSRLQAIRSLEPSTTLPGATSTVPPSTVPRSRTTVGAVTVTKGIDCSSKGEVIATLLWQDVSAYIVLDGRGYAVLDAADCRELVRP